MHDHEKSTFFAVI